MKALLFLAEAASYHDDGTVSVLRAFITHVWAKEVSTKKPLDLRGSLVVRIQPEVGDEGKHKFNLRWMDEDGGEVPPKIEGEFQVEDGLEKKNVLLALNFNAKIVRHGEFQFVLRVDNVVLAQWGLKVLKPPGGK